jgi:hypothetical protein
VHSTLALQDRLIKQRYIRRSGAADFKRAPLLIWRLIHRPGKFKMNISDRHATASAPRPQPDAKRTKVSLIVPVFNSATSLRTLHQAITACATSPTYDFEIVYVDDASADGSLGILRDIGNAAANVVVIEQPRNRGQAKAVLTGIFAARGEIVVTLDDDLQHDPNDIPRLLETLDGAGSAALVMGISDARRRPRWRAWSGICANAISNLFLARPLPLRLTTFCAFRRQLCRHLDPGSDRELPLVTALVQAAERTLTVPVQFRSSTVKGSRYGLTALFRLFMSRTSCYSLSRVLFWFACASLLMISGDALLLADGRQIPVLQALWPASAAAAFGLALLAVRVQRQHRAPDLRQARV